MLMDTILSIASHRSPLWTSLALYSGRVFPNDTNYFSLPSAFKIRSTREYNASGNCVSNSILATFLMDRGTSVIDATDMTEPTSTGGSFTPFTLPNSPGFNLADFE